MGRDIHELPTMRQTGHEEELRPGMVVTVEPGVYVPGEGGVRIEDDVLITHSGCEVDQWLSDEELLYCPCHDSKFDPKNEAKVVDGPAPRVLPALALGIADGKLIVAKPYTSRVGFESQ